MPGCHFPHRSCHGPLSRPSGPPALAALSTGPYLTSSLLSPQLKPDTPSPVESSRNRLEVQGPPSSTLAASNKLERWKQAGLAGVLGPK